MFSKSTLVSAGFLAMQFSSSMVGAAPAASLHNNVRRTGTDTGNTHRADPWSVYEWNGGSNPDYYIEARSGVECDQTMANAALLSATTEVNMLPIGKREILGCRPAPNSQELKNKLLLSLPSPQCTCIEGTDNTVTSSMNKMCALVLGEDESAWANTFTCSNIHGSDDVSANAVHIWSFADYNAAQKASDCLNAIQVANTDFGSLPTPVFETVSVHGGCYIKSNDMNSCTDTANQMTQEIGSGFECNQIGNTEVLAPQGSCYESDSSTITSDMEDACYTLLGISAPNVKYQQLDFTDEATCEISSSFRFENDLMCNMFRACFNEYHRLSTLPAPPSAAPTPAPTPSPSPSPTPSPTQTPPPTPRPTQVRDVRSFCKSKKCSDECPRALGCGWHSTKGCKAWSFDRQNNRMSDGATVSPPQGSSC